MAGAPSVTPAAAAAGAGSDPLLRRCGGWGAPGGYTWHFLGSEILLF